MITARQLKLLISAPKQHELDNLYFGIELAVHAISLIELRAFPGFFVMFSQLKQSKINLFKFPLHYLPHMHFFRVINANPSSVRIEHPAFSLNK